MQAQFGQNICLIKKNELGAYIRFYCLNLLPNLFLTSTHFQQFSTSR